ncbi:hypothetical protein KJ815_03090, partial [bacterium]|nr:hypothetical protein [bacterium]
MQYRRSFRHHFVIFVLLSFIALAQLSWWVIFQLNEGSRVTKLQHRIWTEQIRVASEQAGLWSERPRHELETWLQRVFPDLTLEEASGKIIVSAAAEKRLRRLAGGRVRMYVSEGAFFIFLLLTGIGYMYWVLRREILYEQQQSSFLSATSHELKTPITSLRLHLDTLIDRDLPKAQALDVLSTMRRDLDRLTDQIDRQLQAQAFVFGKRKLSLQPTDLTDETQFILKEISGRYNLKDLQLRTHLEPDVTVMADPERWQILVR